MTSPFPIIGINTNYEPDLSGGDLTQIKPAYWQSVVEAGGLPVLMPQLDDPSMIDAFLDRVDGFLMIGGDDLSDRVLGTPGPPTAIPLTPLREKCDFTLLDRLLERRIPTLAICLACQQLNILHGGSLYRDLPWDGPAVLLRHYSRMGGPAPSHAIEVEPGSALHQILGATEAEVNSFHHQAIREMGEGLVRTAWAPDGITEAIEVAGQPFFLGVQWHPEKTRQTETSRKLFAALLRHAVQSER